MAKKLVWTVEKRKLAELHEWTENPRKIGTDERVRLSKRIDARGFHDILKIDKDDTILSGNQRKGILMEKGYEEIDVMVPNRKLTDEERKMVALESNLMDGSWDYDMLADFGEDLLTNVGFDRKGIEIIFQLDPEKIPTEPEGANSGAVGPAGEGGSYGVMVLFKDELEMREFYDKMVAEGRECRVEVVKE